MAFKNGSRFIGVLACFLVSAGLAAAQTQVSQVPDCPVRTYTFTATGVSGDVDNTSTGCLTWVMDYEAVGFSAINLQFEAAPAATINATTGAATAGAYVAWAGTITNGVNPVIVSPGSGSTRFTDTSGAMMQGYYAAFVHVHLGSATGSGTVKVSIYGFRAGPDANTNSGGSTTPCAGTVAAPCIVAGPDAPGAASTQSPVQIAGNDGTDVRAIRTDTTGRGMAVGAAAAGAAIAGNPVLIGGSDGTNARALSVDTAGEPIPANTSTAAAAAGVSNTAAVPAGAAAAPLMVREIGFQFNGTTLDSNFACTNQAAFTLSAATDVVVVTGVSSTTTRLCYFNFAADSAHTITIRQGTGTTCLTNTATIGGPYTNVSAFDFPFSSLSTLRTTVAARDICLHFDAAVTGGGTAIYAAF